MYVYIAVHGDRFYIEDLAGADYSARNLATISDQNPFNRSAGQAHLFSLHPKSSEGFGCSGLLVWSDRQRQA
jgi:hypothetical protein